MTPMIFNTFENVSFLGKNENTHSGTLILFNMNEVLFLK